MAIRPIFIPSYDTDIFVITKEIEFTWFPGLSISQKQKSISALHNAATNNNYCASPLEVSTKSPHTIGVQLSAFNLSGTHLNDPTKKYTVETIFQSSKVFEFGGPYRDLMYKSSLEAKKDPRLLTSGALQYFLFKQQKWGLIPHTIFYDWIYLNILQMNQSLIKNLDQYDAFTDIEFNPKKSINCQAYSLALFKSLQHRGLLDEALLNQESFIRTISKGIIEPATPTHQLKLI
ncbi:Hypothetical protein F387_01816 [Wohlfahrtiimonas chitiniclastica SH04]|uniref:Uncharacterized protein n=1 Tax=Wohlfahrtiimonas chitiniclastica SH04 TaxID=1261130 RepID=L8XYK3_9GAMM|nr:hypothetical protein [Wohlfahrtiimonas chitiniclastica]ELV07396.1 Hypothetical protein F387_01816 [Wohlfahrtiimonas chitiniclastica SH04]KZX37354.1 hypothetical protein A6V30_00230 [Wohlfahrtiimonas chitiniclastica]MBS7820197.1 hypothetical protein [Wohlfahrtiimonas chitiniclastica]